VAGTDPLEIVAIGTRAGPRVRRPRPRIIFARHARVCVSGRRFLQNREDFRSRTHRHRLLRTRNNPGISRTLGNAFHSRTHYTRALFRLRLKSGRPFGAFGDTKWRTFRAILAKP